MKRQQNMAMIAAAVATLGSALGTSLLADYTRRLRNYGPYKRKKPTRQEDFDRLEKAEIKRRRKGKLLNFAPPYEREVVSMKGIGHHPIPTTLKARYRWEIASLMADTELWNSLTNEGATALVESRARQAMNLENCG